MLTNEFVKDLGKTFFDSIDINWMNSEWKTEIENYPESLSEYLYRTFYNHELVYPKEIIWSFINSKLNTHADEMNHLYETTKYEYNPIWNKDGTTTETRTITGNDERTITDNGTRGITENKQKNTKLVIDSETTDTGTVTDKHTGTDGLTQTGRSTTINSDYPMDSTSDKPVTKSATESSSNSTETLNLTDEQTRKLTGTEDRTDTGTETNINTIEETNGNTQTHKGNDSRSEKYERVEKGNIGVTTTQSMIREEREIILCMYSHLVSEIKQFFYFSI